MQHIDLNQLKKRCLAKETTFPGERLDAGHRQLLFIDNGAKILAVAHLDTVQRTTHFEPVTIKEENKILYRLLFCGQLDDRLGAYILLDYLPSLGIKDYDILLTTGEESGMSTATFFEAPRAYNWMFEFDRRGDDVVMYQYEEKKYKDYLRGASFKVGMGSYTDICDLWTLGCAGFNFGCGYENEHSETAHADLTMTETMVYKFVHFFRKYQHTRMPSSATGGRWDTYQRNYNWHRWDGNYDSCDYCGQPTPFTQLRYVKTEGSWVCPECYAYVFGKIRCASCDRVVTMQDAVEIDDHWYCAECMGYPDTQHLLTDATTENPGRLAVCSMCGELFLERDLVLVAITDHGEEHCCLDCLEELYPPDNNVSDNS